MGEKLLLTIEQATETSSLSRAQINRYIATRELRSRKIGKRRYIPRKELERFCATDHPAPPRKRKGDEGRRK